LWVMPTAPTDAHRHSMPCKGPDMTRRQWLGLLSALGLSSVASCAAALPADQAPGATHRAAPAHRRVRRRA
jgi:hypothetical protein